MKPLALSVLLATVPGLGLAHSYATPPGDKAAGVLGQVRFPVDCAPEAATRFERAMPLLHHMTYPQAREAFAGIVGDHPACAMARWGLAMTLFQPLWPTRPDAAALQRGWDELQQAQALAKTPREQAFVRTAQAFFEDPAGTDYWLRIRRWEAAARQMHEAFPDDDEATLFYALAHLATAPSNQVSREHADRSAELLAAVHRRQPEHPGAMHYLVHANDVPGRERLLLEVVRKYDRIAPRNPHALHMPTHIYTRLGDWDGVIRGNRRAAEAALDHPAGDQGQYTWDEYPHAIEYLVYAHLQKGEDAQAMEAVTRLRAIDNLEPSFKTAFHLASTQARLALERGDWQAAAAIEPRQPASLDWDKFGWPEAIAQFARGLGAARTGQLEVADAARQRLVELEARTREGKEELFARNIHLLTLELDAWLAHARGDAPRSLALMREAVELEASTPKHAVTPGATLPAQELLGDLLIAQSQPAQAQAAYRSSLQRYPGRLNALVGATRAAREAGDAIAAADLRKQLQSLAGASERPSVRTALADLPPAAASDAAPRP